MDCDFNRCVPSPRLATTFAGYLSSLLSLAVCAGLIGAVSFLRQPNANFERPTSVGEPSRELQPAKAGAPKVFSTFAPQGASANAKLAPLGTAAPLPHPSTWQTVITF